MYAAAGGASLASRQARQKQRQNKKSERLQQLKNQKVPELKALQAKQFHNYTDAPVPKLSRVERGTLKPPTQQERRHSTSNYHKEHPVRTRIRESPSICIPVQNHQPPLPLTPTTLVQQHKPIHQSESLQSQLPQIFIPDDNKLERRCSFVRQVEEMEKCAEGGVLDRCNHLCNFEIKEKLWDDHQTAFYTDYDKDTFGSLEYPFSEDGGHVVDNDTDPLELTKLFQTNQDLLPICLESILHHASFAKYSKDIVDLNGLPLLTELHNIFKNDTNCSQGRAAWQERERGRRCSLSEEARQHRIKQSEAHHRWMKRNRIHDSTYGGGSEEDDFFSVYHQSAAANALLYVGLGTTAIGSVIFFVGTGEKGFKTLELRLIGPTLIACGLLCCLIRVLLCACPSTCLRKRKKSRLKNACPHSSSRYPLAPKMRDHPDYIQIESEIQPAMKQKKKVSIVPPNHSLPSTSTTEFKEFLKLSTQVQDNKPKPQINLPEFEFRLDEACTLPRCDSIIELQNLELSYDLESVSSNDSESVTIIDTEVKQSTSKLTRVREPVNVNSSENNETCLSVVNEINDNSEGSARPNDSDKKELTDKKLESSDRQTHSGIVLSPLQLVQ